MNILIVDDTANSRLVLKTHLHAAGSRDLTEVASAAAFEHLGLDGDQPSVESKTDLILMDVLMPDVDGIEACRRVKASPAPRDIPNPDGHWP